MAKKGEGWLSREMCACPRMEMGCLVEIDGWLSREIGGRHKLRSGQHSSTQKNLQKKIIGVTLQPNIPKFAGLCLCVGQGVTMFRDCPLNASCDSTDVF